MKEASLVLVILILFGYGYFEHKNAPYKQTNCTEIEKNDQVSLNKLLERIEHIEKLYSDLIKDLQKNGELTKDYQETKGFQIKNIINIESKDYAKSWGEKMNPSGVIPVGKFKAFYFDRSKPETTVFTNEVDEISIRFNREFQGILPENFAAYWVGDFEFKEEKTQEIVISQSWARYRIFIDNELVFSKKNSSKKFKYFFSKGIHRIEVEFINGTHTTDFLTKIQDVKIYSSTNQIKNYINELKLEDYELYYVSVYKSSKEDFKINLTFNQNNKPIVLWLDSYDVINWVINDNQKNNIQAVICSSYSEASDISGITKDKILSYKGRFGIDKEYPGTCHCSPGGLYCGSNRTSLLQVEEKFERVLAHKLNGYSLSHSTDYFSVPSEIMNDAKRDEIKEKLQDIEKQEIECMSKNNPNFDNLF